MTIDNVAERFADGVSLGDYAFPDGTYCVAVILADVFPESYKVGMLRPIPALRVGLRLVGMSLKALCFKK